MYESEKIDSAPSFNVTLVPVDVGASLTLDAKRLTKAFSDKSPLEFLTLYSKASLKFSEPS